MNMGNSEVIRRCILIASPPTVPVETPKFHRDTPSTRTNPVSDPARENTSAFFPTNPITVVQYFSDRAEGFGHWKVLLSMRCEHHLRKFRRADAKRFAIIEKKIKYILQLYFEV